MKYKFIWKHLLWLIPLVLFIGVLIGVVIVGESNDMCVRGLGLTVAKYSALDSGVAMCADRETALCIQDRELERFYELVDGVYS